MYPNLKMQIFKSGIHQTRLAKEVGIPDTVLSKIIHGYREPTELQKKSLAEYLHVDPGWLFEPFDLVPPQHGARIVATAEANPVAIPNGKPHEGE